MPTSCAARTTTVPIVGIGASAGGLDACKKFLNALPPDTGMAYVLVQHLDPTHESMLVDLLTAYTAMPVVQAVNAVPVEPDRLYIIPPGAYLAVSGDRLVLSQPAERHGARLPFDYFLKSLAVERGPAAVCVILSGSGTDGTIGLRAIKDNGGLAIVQDPAEAGYDGMPRSAIATGAVDFVLPVAQIPGALENHGNRLAPPHLQDKLPEIVDLLRTTTAHDFSLYKTGTLRRRIERRMAMRSAEPADMDRYLETLHTDAAERDSLAKDLLINVTSFFRDPKVFDMLAETIVPDLLRDQPRDQPVRIWVAGCSTGEETYSLAMLFQERIAASGGGQKLQIFASDVDPDAVAEAREGLYPRTIEADVPPARLRRFFTLEDGGYRISADLRATVVFTLQDVLTDPPFSRIDMVSCRNLLIYLRPDAQAKVISMFHFALRADGILLLGGSETIGDMESHFESISKANRLWRHTGTARPGETGLDIGAVRIPRLLGQRPVPSRQARLADLCRQSVTDSFAPAAVLIDLKLECQFSMGPVDRFLRVPAGAATHDLLAMARKDIRTRLRAAIQRATHENGRIVVPGGRTAYDGQPLLFDLDIQPVTSAGETFLLVCFVERLAAGPPPAGPETAADAKTVAALEQELEITRAELQGAIRSLEISNEEQRAINEEALSVQEEFQSTNEELLTSKEELQSLNEELTALNTQLQETLERQRTTANDLQNILYSTDVATIFLDAKLNIRFFTPATRALFNVIPGDVGRPLADLKSLANDDMVLTDARSVLLTQAPVEREIDAHGGARYLRRILPYRTQEKRIEGVVITFADITVRTRQADAMGVAQRQAEQSNVAKSRFLAAASHDLRQPLQTMVLLQGSLTKVIEGDAARQLLTRLDQALGAMSGMLNALLDINQIEAGTVRADMAGVRVAELLDRMREEFIYHAKAKGIDLRIVPCGATVRSDVRLLEQMLRNLLSNAIKYTRHGKVLVGCRRHAAMLSIEVWDTGIGIPDDELQAIFEEYHQIGNAARERSLGLGLGLSIVQRLGKLMGHRVRVGSRLGKGSMFAIEIQYPPADIEPAPEQRARAVPAGPGADAAGAAEILVIEDDPDLADLLAATLVEEGYRTATAPDGAAALDLVARGAAHPHLLLADFNLPNGMNGIQAAAKLREALGRDVPVVILTGDISTDTLRDVALLKYTQLNKPVSPAGLIGAIKALVPVFRPVTSPTTGPAVFIVDDDRQVREGMRELLEDAGHTVEDFESCEAFLEAWQAVRAGCLILDAYLPGMSGLELLARLKAAGHVPPTIMITGNGDIAIAVKAMRAGALDFIEKPVTPQTLAASVARAMEYGRDAEARTAWRSDAADRLAGLTGRQREIMTMVLAGHPSKNIAADLGISQRTVDNHRASIMHKTGAKSLPALARLAAAADGSLAAIPSAKP